MNTTDYICCVFNPYYMKDFTEELILFIRRHRILALVVYTAAVMTVLTMTFSESNDERWLNLNLLDIINRMSD